MTYVHQSCINVSKLLEAEQPCAMCRIIERETLETVSDPNALVVVKLLKHTVVA